MGEVAAPVSRRREALLREGARQQAARLAAEELARLERDRSPDSRASLAARFGQLFDQACGGRERELADAVLRLLARDLAKEVRQALANAMASHADLPHEVALALAHDEIDVARPILQHSPVLKDEDLMQVVRTHALQYALAVTGRSQISEAVSDALVATGDAAVVASLVANEGARLSRSTLNRVMEDFGTRAEVQARLVRRPALPFELVERLVGMIGERVEQRLVAGQQLAPDQARKVMEAVRERAAISFTARGHSDAQLARWLQGELEDGRLDHEAILRFLKNGEVAALEIGIGLLAGIKPARARWLLYQPDRRHLAALCLEADFATPHYLALRMALDVAEEAAGAAPGTARGYKPETVLFLQEQYETLRADRPMRQKLLDAAGRAAAAELASFAGRQQDSPA